MPAVTLAGWQAKARALQSLHGDCPELAASLAADVKPFGNGYVAIL
ncbi:MAG TPA: hypothetical protein VGG99_30035 [Acetobacteraceae bacterium]|jgi:hypothetical protein